MLPSCKKVTELISQAQDEKLSLKLRLQIKLHLLLCKGCQHYCQQIKWLRCATQSLIKRGDNSAEKLSDETRKRIEAKLRSESTNSDN